MGVIAARFKARNYCELIAGIEDSNGSEERVWSAAGEEEVRWWGVVSSARRDREDGVRASVRVWVRFAV